MDSFTQLVAAYALLLLLGLIAGGLLALLLIWSGAKRVAPALRSRYSRISHYFGGSAWLGAVTRKLPGLRALSHAPGALVMLSVASFCVILLAMLAFGELADGIGPGEELHAFDRALSQAFAQERSRATDLFFGIATHLGGGVVLTVLALAVGVALLVKGNRVLLYVWIAALGGTGLLNRLLKEWFQRERPGDTPLLPTWSFPSGHAMNSMVAYGMLAYLALRLLPRSHMPWIVSAVVTIVLVVGTSRLVLQFHYFSDVVAGFAAGLAWLAVCITASELAHSRRGRRAA